MVYGGVVFSVWFSAHFKNGDCGPTRARPKAGHSRAEKSFCRAHVPAKTDRNLFRRCGDETLRSKKGRSANWFAERPFDFY
jgi:hypothetical protein